MREIKFRGYDEENKKWVYGWYTKLTEGIRRFDAIISEENDELIRYYIHNRRTIGRYTGLKDESGVEIYEGDVVELYNIKYIVRFGKNPDTGIICFYLENTVEDFTTYKLIDGYKVKVVEDFYQY